MADDPYSIYTKYRVSDIISFFYKFYPQIDKAEVPGLVQQCSEALIEIDKKTQGFGLSFLWTFYDDPAGTKEINLRQVLTAIEWILLKKNIPGYFDQIVADSIIQIHQDSTALDKADVNTLIETLDKFYGIGIVLRDGSAILQQMKRDLFLDPEYLGPLNKLQDLRISSDPIERRHYQKAREIFVWIDDLLVEYDIYEKRASGVIDNIIKKNPTWEGVEDFFRNNFMKAFTKDGVELTFASAFEDTQEKIGKFFQKEFVRPDNGPATTFPWEMRIGAARFFVPPVDVKVSQHFGVGSLSGGALRQATSPKFNSGHSETAIQVTLYFPTAESIWGIKDADKKSLKDLNFDDIKVSSDEDIDFYLSSLRGLITQFKYAPFLPIRNTYLNSAWNITGVVLQGMSISTVENYPFCLAVNLNMMKFNHKVFMPMIEDFHQAIHWGRFRQYMGRASKAMSSKYSLGFLTETQMSANNGDNTTTNNESKPTTPTPLPDTLTPNRSNWFNDPLHLNFYYPSKTPAKIFAPDDSMFRQPDEDAMTEYDRGKNSWETFLGYIGIQVDTNPDFVYDTVINNSRTINPYISEITLLTAYLNSVNYTVQEMTLEELNKYLEKRIKELKANGTIPEGDQDKEDQMRNGIKQAWTTQMLSGFQNTVFYRTYLENARYKNGKIVIQEWDVPMDKMTFDEKSMFLQGISVSLSNNFSKLQVQLHDEPTYQHIGGGDSRIDLSMIIVGEDNLTRVRRMFDRIGGLARLEHAHGVLGFLGVKNQIAGLAGIKYLLPLTYEADSIPGFPRVYDVRLSFVDFDIYQQRNEKLSSALQKDLIQSFGKRNPFLRIKQLWGKFNCYPDFPLEVKDPENDEIVGHLEPDFYFRTFQTIDHDITFWAKDTRNTIPVQTQPDGTTKATQTEAEKEEFNSLGFDIASRTYQEAEAKTNAFDTRITHYFGPVNADQSKSAIVNVFNGGQFSVGTQTKDDDKPQTTSKDDYQGLSFYEDSHVAQTNEPVVAGLTPASKYMAPYAYNSSDPSKQYELMMRDTRYRDLNGRMIRAFPTYMLWLIEEGGRFGGVKLFDNFYGLQSILDFSVNRSEDILGDTLVLRLSNLYSRLTSPIKGKLVAEDGREVLPVVNDENVSGSISDIIDHSAQMNQNILSGTKDNLFVELDSIRLKPGVRVHLRMGYSSNPNALDTVFNGVITQVQAGEIIEVTAQSDAIELSQYINTTNNKGHSGKVDGAINTGFWLSEPRDLMVRLLSMGSSHFKEQFSYATSGQVFSEGRFGIRHFGSILYEPLNELESLKHEMRYQSVSKLLGQYGASENITKAISDTVVNTGNVGVTGNTQPGVEADVSERFGGGFDGFLGAASVRMPLVGVMQSMWTNFFRKRDYELYKRNIYPGNGLGIAQYLGGDLLDSGSAVLEAAGYRGLDQESIYGPKNIAGTVSRADGKSEYDSSILAMSIRGRIIDFQKNPDGTPKLDASGNLIPLNGQDSLPAANPTATLESAYDTTTQEGKLQQKIEDVIAKTGDDFGRSMLGGGLESSLKTNKSIVGRGSWKNHPLLQAIGIAKPGDADDDLSGFDEVSFRAQTYMKTVWDMFTLCSALLPNYVVSVRPFEDRSTVFYGKPHWLYTSGVIPLSTGVPKDNDNISIEQGEAEFQKIMRDAAEKANPLADLEKQTAFLAKLDAVDPFTVTADQSQNVPVIDGVNLIPANTTLVMGGAKIPARTGKVALGKHLSGVVTYLPTERSDLVNILDTNLQKKINDLVPQLKDQDNPDLTDLTYYVHAYLSLVKENGDIDKQAWVRNKVSGFSIPNMNMLNNSSIRPLDEYLRDPKLISEEDQNKKVSYIRNDVHNELSNLPDNRKYSNWNEAGTSYPNPFSIPMSLIEEQYYISMRWPVANWNDILGITDRELEKKEDRYQNPQDYKDVRIVVGNPRNNKIIVCAAGPPVEILKDVSFTAALSPDVYHLLEIQENDECTFGFVPNSTPLGMSGNESNQAAQTLGAALQTAVTGMGNDYDFFVTQRDPGESFMKLEQMDQEKLYADETYFVNSFLYGWIDYGQDTKSNQEVRTKSFRSSGVKVKPSKETDASEAETYISGATMSIKGTTNNFSGNFDIIGEYARRIYDKKYNERRKTVVMNQDYRDYYDSIDSTNTTDKLRAVAEEQYNRFDAIRKSFPGFGGITESQAEDTWDDFRRRWHIRKKTDDNFKEVREAAVAFLTQLGLWPATNDQVEAGLDKWYDGVPAKDTPDDSKWEEKILFSTNMTTIVNNFKKLMWQLPYARAWLAITTDNNTNSDDSTGQSDANWATSETTNAWRWFLGFNKGNSPSDVSLAKENFSPDFVGDYGKIVLGVADLKDEVLQGSSINVLNEDSLENVYKYPTLIKDFLNFLRQHNTPGKKGEIVTEQTLEDLRDAWDATGGALLSFVGSAISGVVGMFRMSLMEMGYGMSMLGTMQAQANILNKAFNDSIYYSTGEAGSLIRMADNPFTREYGEPVVEVREPFQRFHYVNSFQDIIDNGIIENLSNVPTVITASSDGKYPVTVYFDKGASPEKQVEVGVETGLFWDNARGSGFFGFLHPLFHPIETLRGIAKSASGSSDEILSKRVGLHHLKEGLKDIYTGELLILGRADIRPFDLVYLSDVYERMYGIFEVEAVNHHFTSDMGFVTSITPNAVVTINDPARWTMQSWIWGLFGIQDTRNHLRHLLSVNADKSTAAYTTSLGIMNENGEIQQGALAEIMQDNIRGSVQYTGGNTALLRDMSSHIANGFARPSNGSYKDTFSLNDDGTKGIIDTVATYLNSPAASIVGAVPGIGFLQDLAWEGWSWVRDNLLDQHGCYIQYLTKEGQPMDAGLSFNQGVAVGSHNSKNLLPGILGLQVKTLENGHRRITINDLMSQLGWSETEIAGIHRNVSMWNDAINSEVLKLAGRSPDLVSMAPPEVYLVKVAEISETFIDEKTGEVKPLREYNLNGIIDGDTFIGQRYNDDGTLKQEQVRFRLAGVNSSELEYKNMPSRNDSTNKAFIARQFLEKRLITDQVSAGYEPIVAVRVANNLGDQGKGMGKDKYGRTLGVIFHNTPSGVTSNEDRKKVLLETATRWPLVEWDSYMTDGRPFTANWELVMAGLAKVDMGGVGRNDPDRGVRPSGE